MPPKIILRVVEGEPVGKELVVEKPATCVIGRAKDCCFVLSHYENAEMVSRHHCQLDANPPKAWLRDLGSLNGTFVNGVKLGQRPRHQAPERSAGMDFREQELFHGDRIKVGRTVIEFVTHQPKVCRKCHGEIAEEHEVEAFQEEGGFFLCPACKEKQSEAN